MIAGHNGSGKSTLWYQRLAGGRIESKADTLARVLTRQQQGGHAVPRKKLIERFPRTRRSVGAKHVRPWAQGSRTISHRISVTSDDDWAFLARLPARAMDALSARLPTVSLVEVTR